MKCLGLSAFLTITALSIAGLVSHSAAQQGPSATPPAASPAQGPSATQPPAPSARQGPCQQITAACRQAGFVQNGASKGVGLAVDCVRPIVEGKAQRVEATKPLPQVRGGGMAASVRREARRVHEPSAGSSRAPRRERLFLRVHSGALAQARFGRSARFKLN